MNLKLSHSIESIFLEHGLSYKSFLFCLKNHIVTVGQLYDLLKANTDINADNFIIDELSNILNLVTDDEFNIGLKGKYLEKSMLREMAKFYETEKSFVSVRTKNVLDYLEMEYYYPSSEFFFYLVYNQEPEKAFLKLRNSGNKTVQEIISVTNKLSVIFASQNFEELIKTPVLEEMTLESVQIRHISEKEKIIINNLIDEIRKKLTVRAENGICSLLKEYSTTEQFVEFLMKSNWNLLIIKNIGKKSASELNQALEELREVIHELLNSEEVPESIQNLSSSMNLQKIFGLEKSETEFILNAFPDVLEKPPVFHIINIIIQRDLREKDIWMNCINVFRNQLITDLNEIAKKLDLSRERIRQLRSNLINSLFKRIRSWVLLNPALFTHYSYLLELNDPDEIVKETNDKELVNFNCNFITKILQSIYSDRYIILEDDENLFFGKSYTNNIIQLIPIELDLVFNFEAFKKNINTQLSNRIYDPYTLEFFDFHLKFYRNEIAFEKIPEIVEICKKIIQKDFNLSIEGNLLVFPHNAIRNIPEILEEILRENKKVMSLDELYKEIEIRYPGITKSKDALRGSILRNENIRPLGRTSVYALKEWIGSENRAGTIREIAFEFLTHQDKPKLLEEVTEYIKGFRPDTNLNSVYSNLYADQSKRFSIYTIKGKKFVGLT